MDCLHACRSIKVYCKIYCSPAYSAVSYSTYVANHGSGAGERSCVPTTACSPSAQPKPPDAPTHTLTAMPLSGSIQNCVFAAPDQHPLGA